MKTYREKRPVMAGGTGRELVYPGAMMTREQARRYGERQMPHDLKRAGFRAHVFASDPVIHGARYFRITYGKEVCA